MDVFIIILSTLSKRRTCNSSTSFFFASSLFSPHKCLENLLQKHHRVPHLHSIHSSIKYIVFALSQKRRGEERERNNTEQKKNHKSIIGEDEVWKKGGQKRKLFENLSPSSHTIQGPWRNKKRIFHSTILSSRSIVPSVWTRSEEILFNLQVFLGKLKNYHSLLSQRAMWAVLVCALD